MQGFWLTLFVGSVMVGPQISSTRSEELYSPQPTELINSTERLAVEQIDALISAQQSTDAIAQLQRLKDIPPKLIESGPIQSAATQQAQGYLPLSRWCERKLQAALSADEPARRAFNDQWTGIAESTLVAVQQSHDTSQVSSAVDRFRNTPVGDKLALLRADLRMERGEMLAAAQSLDSDFPALCRVELDRVVPGSPSIAVSWADAWQAAIPDKDMQSRLLALWRQKAQAVGEPVVVQVLTRQLTAAAVDPQLLDASLIPTWASVVAEDLSDPALRQRLRESIEEVASWDRLARSPKPDSARSFTLDRHPNWQQQLERWPNGSDLTPASRPAVGQLSSSLPYAPVIHQGKVFLHELTKITVRELSNGRTWPGAAPDIPLFDSQLSSTNYLPLGYPLQGTPKPGLTLSGDCLYARMGSPVTGWYSRSRSDDGGSFSYLVGLDLKRQGSLLRGFPLRLTEPQFVNAEFEGVPVVIGDLLITAITERDNVNLRRSLAAFDRFSGRLQWRTKALGVGTVVGSDRANLISATQPIAAGGLVYYQTDLGSVACIDAVTGATVWLTRYARDHQLQSDYPRAHRYRYRDGNACIVHRGVLYLVPQDCPELIALDALNGDLRWSTNEDDVADCTHILGISGNSLIAAGDRLVWLDAQYGSIQSQFPARTTPGITNSLAQPRGLGRGILIEDRIYWPTAAEVLVFPAAMPAVSKASSLPAPVAASLARISTALCGSEGGNLTASGPWIVLATPGRLICFGSAP